MKKLILIIIIFPFLCSLTYIDSSGGKIIFYGKVTLQDKILASDSIKIVQHFAFKAINQKNIVSIYTDKDGNYSYELEWWTPCRSSHYTDCKDPGSDECFHYHARLNNPDYLGFMYNKKEIKIHNPYWEIYKSNGANKTTRIKKDLLFE